MWGTGCRFAIVVLLLLLLLLGLCFAAAAAPEAFAGSNRSDTSVECSLVSGVTCKQKQQRPQQPTLGRICIDNGLQQQPTNTHAGAAMAGAS
jgi:hypothetical protein